MPTTALAARILPGKLEDWKEWSLSLREEPRRSDFLAIMKKSGLSRVRVWLQEDPDNPLVVILYEGDTPERFLRHMGTSQEPFAVWFRERVKNTNGYDLTKPPIEGPSELINDFHLD